MRPIGSALVLVGLLSLALPALAAPLNLPQPKIDHLANGLQVIWFVNDQIPVVDFNLLVNAGYRDDPAGKSGTAELVSEALQRGAAGLSAQELARQVEMLGASQYASVDEDTFSVGIHGLTPDAPELLELMAKVATRPDFPEGEVKREQARLLDRWSHISEYGETLASLAYQRSLSANTIYGRGRFSSIAEFERVTPADAVAYYRRHFTPKNGVLLIVGRVKPEEFIKQVEAAFGHWKGEAPVRSKSVYADKRLGAPKKGQVLLVDRPKLNQAQVRIGFRAPSIQDPRHFPLTVGNTLLGEYFNSRLNSLIRDKLALTYSIRSGFSYSRELASFTLSAATRNDSVGKLLRETLEALKQFKDGPIEAAEVRMAKDYIEGSFPLSTSTLQAIASRWLASFLYGLGTDYLNRYIPRIREVTLDQVQSAVKSSFAISDAVIVVAGDAKEIRKSLAKDLKGFKLRQVSVRELQ
jgi:zinc protease